MRRGGIPFLFYGNMAKKVEKIHATNADGEEAYFHPQSWAAMPVGEDGKRYGWTATMQAGAKSERPVATAQTAKSPGRPAKVVPEFGDVNKD